MKTCHHPPHVSAAFLPPSLYREDSERGSRKQGERLRQSMLSQQMLLLLNTKAPTNATPKANEKQRGLETPSTSTCHKMKHKSTNLNVFLPFILHCTLCSIFQKGSLQSIENFFISVCSNLYQSRRTTKIALIQKVWQRGGAVMVGSKAACSLKQCYTDCSMWNLSLSCGLTNLRLCFI